MAAVIAAPAFVVASFAPALEKGLVGFDVVLISAGELGVCGDGIRCEWQFRHIFNGVVKSKVFVT